MKTEMMRIKAIAAAVVFTFVAASGAMATVLYNQNSDDNGAYSSQNDTNGFGNFATVYDNFTLGGNSSVMNVMFTGSYFNPPSQGAINAFTINFFSDAGGMPGGLLQSFNMAGVANETSIGTDNVGDPLFTYSFDLSSSFNALGGTQYWMSIVPDLDFPPQWGWESGTGGDGVAYQDFFGARSQLMGDLAFTLNGDLNRVPESGSTVVLLGGVLIALGLLRRRLSVAG